MRFTSLVVELIRARPRLVVWLVVLLQATLWLMLPVLFYRSPPGELATVLAFGREYQVGTYFGPPLAFWLADIAFRAVGNHMFGVYLLAQLCAIVTFWSFYQLARSIVGGQQAVLAVLLSMTVVAFSSPGVEFGPLVLARPLWALLLLHSWQIIGQNRRSAWFAWSIEAGLLLLTTSAAIGLLLLVAGFAVATVRGRRTLMSLDPLYALLVIVVLALPWLIWIIRADVLTMPPWPAINDLSARALHWGGLLGGLVLAMSGVVLLAVLNSGWFARHAEDAPIIYRPPVDPLARQFVYCFAIGPALLGSLVAGVFNLDRVAGGPGVALLMSGLAAIVATGDLIHLRRQRLLRSVWAAAVAAPAFVAIAATLFLPWTGSADVPTSLPAKAIAHFFGDSFERRTNQKLRAVTGDPQLASFIAMDNSRPHLLLDATPERTPWLSVAKFNETGGVVVWRASDTSGTPPPELAQRFPGLVPEVPRAFEWLVNGRLPLLRVGWAIVRPKGQ
ncbi:glycosyltransferase family 39 protein [Bradyrhizobium sp. KBS0727]|uniref:glycosyltransferase family 39 protein n=1 Tax=unclassified Bradyrhizobium TaxID=2631580 RepID=UPI00110EE667|nr:MULTISPECIES: glycosyltransferase family 39 protein [unclassified Bradyrhizobium]QDW37106.1 glycosyltransferase family 39 protein [Bradyrhizobium sp. KBS0725]QDW43706.1 glycosyltransferase family 39 protein [Bradyrhizobium sp. KBS0727]